MESDNSQAAERKAQLVGMGWYRWKCQCCGPKNGEARRLANRWLRRKRKLQTRRILTAEE